MTAYPAAGAGMGCKWEMNIALLSQHTSSDHFHNSPSPVSVNNVAMALVDKLCLMEL
jgi:hypothetical protein